MNELKDIKDIKIAELEADVRDLNVKLTLLCETDTNAFKRGALNRISTLEYKLETADKNVKAASDEKMRLFNIAMRCISDDEETEESIKLNTVGAWMLKFLDGEDFPT